MRRQRPSARLLVLEPEGRILLFHFSFSWGPLKGDDFWGTPGGALDPGETHDQAARRELREETGLDLDPGPEIAQRTARFLSPKGEPIEADERYFLVRAPAARIDPSGHTALERDVMRRHHWWNRAEIETTAERIHPVDILTILDGAP